VGENILILTRVSYDSFMSPDPMAVLITGAYGTGKPAVIEELAGILEASGVAFAMLDLDYMVVWGQRP
jgi:adenylylsulfate kinase-like enzyme